MALTDDPKVLGRIGGYEVLGVIGCGGMGLVFKAHDRSLDRVVAIIEKLHAQAPSQRLQSAEEVSEVLEGCLAHVQRSATTPLPVGVQALAAPWQSSTTELL